MPGLIPFIRKTTEALDGFLARWAARNPVSPELDARILRFLGTAAIALLLALPIISLHRITWDTPSQLGWDGCLYTDEGFYSGDAITYNLEGEWYIENEYNQYINLPLLQWIQGYTFKLFGVSLLVARMINWFFLIAWLGVVFLLFRRFLPWEWAAVGASLVMMNHVTFGMVRFALAEIPMSFFGTLAILLATYSKGPRAYLWASLTAVVYAMAVLTKTNVVFIAPVIAAVMILVDLRWRPILIKFVLCSVIFFAIIGTYFLFFIRPNLDEFIYFFSLNVGVAASAEGNKLLMAIDRVARAVNFGDPIIMYALPALFAIHLLFNSRDRWNPLFWICASFYLMYFALYTYYGRVYPRFFTVSYPAVYGMAVVVMYGLWQVRERFFYLTYPVLLLMVLAASVNLFTIGRYIAETRNSYNEMAAEILEIVNNDPSGNRVVIGHHACSLALRTGLIPRHDRYGIVPLEERLRIHRPGWFVSENVMRFSPRDGYHSQREWIDRFFEVELIGRWNILQNYRGYPVTLYRLTPREEEMNFFATNPRSTRQAKPNVPLR